MVNDRQSSRGVQAALTLAAWLRSRASANNHFHIDTTSTCP